MILDTQELALTVSVEEALTLIQTLSTMLTDHHRGYQQVIFRTLPMTVQDGVAKDDGTLRQRAGKLILELDNSTKAYFHV